MENVPDHSKLNTSRGEEAFSSTDDVPVNPTFTVEGETLASFASSVFDALQGPRDSVPSSADEADEFLLSEIQSAGLMTEEEITFGWPRQ